MTDREILENRERAIERICAELVSAMRKFPTYPNDAIHAAAILAEEAGELIRAAFKENMEQEAIHCGAMALRFLVNLDKMRSFPCGTVGEE